MKDETLKHHHNATRLPSLAKAFLAGRTFQDYTKDELLHSGVERKLEIVGEPFNCIKGEEPKILKKN